MSNDKEVQEPGNGDPIQEREDPAQGQEGQAQPEGRIEKRILIMRNPTKLEIKSGYVLRKVGQAYMVMPTGPRMKEYEGMITLNETGAFLFKEMQKPDQTIEKLRQACVDEYSATEQEAADAVQSFLFQCCECALVEYEDTFVDEDGNRMNREEFDAMRQRYDAMALAREREAEKGEGDAGGRDA